MVNVGVVGLGSDWEIRFSPALRKLRDRIAVRAVYDPVASRAQQVAAEWNAAAVEGLVALVERSDIRAVLLLDAGWAGWHAVQLLCAAAKPVLIVNGFHCEASPLQQLHAQALSLGQTLMPSFGLRYSPASSRLRELIATRLGPVTSLTLKASTSSNVDTTSLFFACSDWCRYVIGSAAIHVEAVAATDRGDALESSGMLPVTLRFPATDKQGDAVSATLRLRAGSISASAENRPSIKTTARPVQATVVCENGTATLESESSIAWQVGEDSVSESLTSERTETEVMLDLFCRRVVGGLIPVADVSDVLLGVQLLNAVRESQQSGRTVTVVGTA